MHPVRSHSIMHVDAILSHVLPKALHTPAGWHNKIIQSDSMGTQEVRRHTFADQHCQQTDSFVNRQDTIGTIEQQEPPLIIGSKLSNNLVTYKQNISLQYIPALTPPPLGPINIRK
jgi:hypothetical protein